MVLCAEQSHGGRILRQRFNKINFSNKDGHPGIGDYSDFNNNNSLLVQNISSSNGFTIVGGAQTSQNTTNNSKKGVKYSNDNVKKMN